MVLVDRRAEAMFFSDRMDQFYNLEVINEKWAYII